METHSSEDLDERERALILREACAIPAYDPTRFS